jgi:hypothetical protein
MHFTLYGLVAAFRIYFWGTLYGQEIALCILHCTVL